jgi:hypothetical protein
MSKITDLVNCIYTNKYGYKKYEESSCDQGQLLGELLRITKLDDQNLHILTKHLNLTTSDMESIKRFIYALHMSSVNINC